MLIRYKPWAVDGLDSHTRDIGLRKLVFEDAQGGILDVRHRADIERLLRDPGTYEIAYERYGIVFDAQGVEVVEPPPIPCVPAGLVINNPRASPPVAPVEKKKPGRPKRR